MTALLINTSELDPHPKGCIHDWLHLFPSTNNQRQWPKLHCTEQGLDRWPSMVENLRWEELLLLHPRWEDYEKQHIMNSRQRFELPDGLSYFIFTNGLIRSDNAKSARNMAACHKGNSQKIWSTIPWMFPLSVEQPQQKLVPPEFGGAGNGSSSQRKRHAFFSSWTLLSVLSCTFLFLLKYNWVSIVI